MVGMIDLRLKTDLFDGYEYPEEPVTLDVNIEKLEECVREAWKGDTVTSSAVREQVRGNEKFVLRVAVSNGVTSTFSMPSTALSKWIFRARPVLSMRVRPRSRWMGSVMTSVGCKTPASS